MKLKLLLIIILLLGFVLRIYRLDLRPTGFTWDEAALGYNAYSILKTARDEYGQIFPIVFKSFGDYKPGLYIYFTVPAIKLLGLNEFATRLPSAIFGTLLLAVIFVLSGLLFPKNLNIGIWSLVIGTVNPWLIQFSRGAWEANLNLLLTTLAVSCFLMGLKKVSNIYYLISCLFFGLTFWTYQSAKLFTPLLLFSLLFIYRKKVSLKRMIMPILLLVILLFPIIFNFAGQSGRLKVFSVFSYTRKSSDVTEILRQDNTSSKNMIYYLYHTEVLDQTRGVLQRYLNHLSPRFLFSEGDWTSLRHSVYKQGYFYLLDVFPMIIGFIVFMTGLKNRGYQLLATWLILAPLPAAFSRDLVSGVRSLQLAIPLILILAIGMSYLAKNRTILGLYTIFLTFFIVYYLDFYYLHQPFYAAREWVSPYKQTYNIVKDNWNKYSKFYITDKLGQPYIFALFYMHYDPGNYQKQSILVQNTGGDVGVVTGFDKFVFGPVYWPQLRSRNNTVTIGDEYELPDNDLNIPGLIRLADVNYPNGQPGLKIVAIP